MISRRTLERIYVTLVLALGSWILVTQLARCGPVHPVQFGSYLFLAIIASGLNLGIPAITGAMPLSVLFGIIAIPELSLPEALLVGCSAVALRSFWHASGCPKPIQVSFSVSCMAGGIALAYGIYHGQFLRVPEVLLFLAASCAIFIATTFPVAVLIALNEGGSPARIWTSAYFPSFPFCLAAGAVAALFEFLARSCGWQFAALCLPLAYFIYSTCRFYVDRLQEEKQHARQMASLHLRAIEALALAIDAKDYATSTHLRRVQVYALALGRELGLASSELEALRAAALLHDIGKLAVPEHITSKPGKLTPEEFDKVKTHSEIGAEILERVEFPYPVVPIVRAHHEKWDGTGYPHGLQGEQIPVGARILAVVDCLDALVNDRPYRPALSLTAAMEKIRSEAGSSFDPQIVEILGRRYQEFENLALRRPIRNHKSFPEAGRSHPAAVVTNGRGHLGPGSVDDCLGSIAAAGQEVQAFIELSQDLGKSLSLNDTLAVLTLQLKRMVPHHSLALYIRRDQCLVPEYIHGEDLRLFSSLSIPLGQGPSGWAAENRTPVLNGDPSLEAEYLSGFEKTVQLRSALAVPLEGSEGVAGVLTLYQTEPEAFTRDHLRILLALASKVSVAVENALKFRQVENSAVTDYLTGLPNGRSLFLHLDHEIARCRRSETPVTVLVGDLDGFKGVNDRFGHLEGNRLLQQVAKNLVAACREYDYVARLGGDEFVLTLPGLSQAAVRGKIEQFTAAVIEAGRSVTGEETVTLSVGQAAFPNDGADAEALLAEADRRMYRAKQENKRASARALKQLARVVS